MGGGVQNPCWALRLLGCAEQSCQRDGCGQGEVGQVGVDVDVRLGYRFECGDAGLRVYGLDLVADLDAADRLGRYPRHFPAEMSASFVRSHAGGVGPGGPFAEVHGPQLHWISPQQSGGCLPVLLRGSGGAVSNMEFGPRAPFVWVAPAGTTNVDLGAVVTAWSGCEKPGRVLGQTADLVGL